MTAKLLIPILHFPNKIPDGTIWVMHQSVTLMQINPTDWGPLTAHLPRDLYELTDRDTGCFYITLPSNWTEIPESIRESKVNRWATMIRFSLHRFMTDTSGPLQLTFAVEINDEKFSKLYHLTTVDSSYSPVMKTFILPREEKRATINTYFAALLDASNKLTTLIAYERFNSSLFRVSLEDKLIDCTISAESLIGATTELSYKFSLFLSFVAGQDASLRTYAFSLLKSMYDARSKLVHGDPKANDKLKSVTSSWPDTLKVILGCLDYYIIHHAQLSSAKSDWIEHLSSLVIGTASRTATVCEDLKLETDTTEGSGSPPKTAEPATKNRSPAKASTSQTKKALSVKTMPDVEAVKPSE